MNFNAETLFTSLANTIRLRCLMLLQSEGELCVCELTHALNLSQPMISRHLGLLRDAGLVTDRRVGVWIYYALNTKLPGWAKTVLLTTAKGIRQEKWFVQDLQKLHKMPNRPDATCCA
jgi:ArsR family transcriptional regulator